MSPASGSTPAIDSKLTRSIRDLAGRFEHKLFLSATPHNGHSNSFSTLLEILDPTRFCRGVAVRKQDLEDVMVRRFKEDLRPIGGERPERLAVVAEWDPADRSRRLRKLSEQKSRQALEDLEASLQQRLEASAAITAALKGHLAAAVAQLRDALDRVVEQRREDAAQKLAERADEEVAGFGRVLAHLGGAAGVDRHRPGARTGAHPPHLRAADPPGGAGRGDLSEAAGGISSGGDLMQGLRYIREDHLKEALLEIIQ